MTTTKTLIADIKRSESLWERLEASLLDAEKAIIEIIASQAWEPLGYASFAEAWAAKMSDITIAVEIRSHVVYQMFNEGLTADEVAATLKGIGPETAGALKRQKDNGVPANEASTIVRRHKRKLPGVHGYLRIKVGRDTLKEWKRVAQAHGTTVECIALSAVEAAFEGLS